MTKISDTREICWVTSAEETPDSGSAMADRQVSRAKMVVRFQGASRGRIVLNIKCAGLVEGKHALLTRHSPPRRKPLVRGCIDGRANAKNYFRGEQNSRLTPLMC